MTPRTRSGTGRRRATATPWPRASTPAPFKPGVTKDLALPARPGLGTESHDITFNEDGSRAYSAALSQGVIIDTTDPGAPAIVTSS